MKRGILVAVMVLSFVMVTSFMVSGVLADEHMEDETLSDMSIYGGAYYTTFADSDLDELEEELDLDLSSGFGIKAGGEMAITPEFGLAAEYTRIFNSDSVSDTFEEDEQTVDVDIDISMPINALRGDAVLYVSQFIEQENVPEIKLTGGAGYYFGEMKFEFTATDGIEEYSETETEDYSGLGIKLGLSVEQEVADDFSVRGDLGYRILDLEIVDDDLNANGLEVGGGVAYSF